MKHFCLSAGAVALILTLLQPAIATPETQATWTLTGEITHVPPELASGEIVVGQTLISLITYDYSIPPAISTPEVRAYFSIQQMTVDVGAFHYSGDGGLNGQIDLYGPEGDPPGIVVISGNPLADMTINGIGGIEFKVQLDSPTAPGMTPTLTDQPPILENFNGRAFNLFAGGAYAITGIVTSIPEPAFPAGLGLTALVCARRRRIRVT